MFFAITLPVGVHFNFVKTGRIPEQADSKFISFFYNCASKGFKNGYNYFWACVCETSVLIRLPESRKKFGLLKLFLQKNHQIIFLII
jgi:hypothetical protein